MRTTVPVFHELMNPLIQALHSLGGSAKVDELLNEVVSIMDLSDDIAGIPHGRGGMTEVGYRLTWARTYLKKFGLIDNSSRGVWSFTPTGSTVTEVDPGEVVTHVRALSAPSKHKDGGKPPEQDDGELPEQDEEVDSEASWKGELMETLLKMDPAAFERLVIRVLRESGFDDVKVTGKSGDGGIDGKGIVRINNGLLSFHTIVQCKRYRPDRLVNASEIRDFRGAMTGRTDKGIFMTTSGFTRGAVEEATRDGAPPLDLISGGQLVEMLKEMGLGVVKKTVTVVDTQWFAGI